ncbi:MAG TPA: YlbF family regulator [Verrucomicrobiota bacterium]|nr:YlbF family regulator [Verrucomicrobiota bacterium]HNU51145.1 YlbF family regulator [Verrucomicrobiota bacterium]
MHSTSENGVVLAKTLELCGVLAADPDVVTLRQQVEAFLADDAARLLYQTVAEKGDALHRRQQQGLALEPADIADFERERDALLGNDVARGFLEAQQKMHEIQELVTRYVRKTMELGRVPGPDDFQSCGQGCSCH